MKMIKITTDEEGHKTMQHAANYAQLPLSLWARNTLLVAARAAAHKKLCETPARMALDYTWGGVACTKAEYMAHLEDTRQLQDREQKLMRGE